MMRRKAFVKRHIVTIAKFFLLATVLQCFALLLCTSSGLSLIYSCVVRLSSHRVTVGDDSYVDYYVFRDELENADIISLVLDKDMPEAYMLTADFLESARYSASLGAIALDEPYSITLLINECALAESYSELTAYINELSELDASEGLLSFAEAIYTVNSALPPKSRLTVECINEDYYVDHAFACLAAAIDGKTDALPQELCEYVENGDYSAVCEFFTVYEDCREMCSDELNSVAEVAAPLFDPTTNGASSRLARISELEESSSAAVLFIIGSDCASDDLFASCTGNRLSLDIVCSDDGGESVSADGFSCRLVKLSDLDWFEKYRSVILGKNGASQSEYAPAYRFYIGG